MKNSNNVRQQTREGDVSDWMRNSSLCTCTMHVFLVPSPQNSLAKSVQVLQPPCKSIIDW